MELVFDVDAPGLDAAELRERVLRARSQLEDLFRQPVEGIRVGEEDAIAAEAADMMRRSHSVPGGRGRGGGAQAGGHDAAGVAASAAAMGGSSSSAARGRSQGGGRAFGDLAGRAGPVRGRHAPEQVPITPPGPPRFLAEGSHWSQRKGRRLREQWLEKELQRKSDEDAPQKPFRAMPVPPSVLAARLSLPTSGPMAAAAHLLARQKEGRGRSVSPERLSNSEVRPPPFRAQPVPWRCSTPLYKQMLHEDVVACPGRRSARAEKLMRSSSLPPRMGGTAGDYWKADTDPEMPPGAEVVTGKITVRLSPPDVPAVQSNAATVEAVKDALSAMLGLDPVYMSGKLSFTRCMPETLQPAARTLFEVQYTVFPEIGTTAPDIKAELLSKPLSYIGVQLDIAFRNYSIILSTPATICSLTAEVTRMDAPPGGSGSREGSPNLAWPSSSMGEEKSLRRWDGRPATANMPARRPPVTPLVPRLAPRDKTPPPKRRIIEPTAKDSFPYPTKEVPDFALLHRREEERLDALKQLNRGRNATQPEPFKFAAPPRRAARPPPKDPSKDWRYHRATSARRPRSTDGRLVGDRPPMLHPPRTTQKTLEWQHHTQRLMQERREQEIREQIELEQARNNASNEMVHRVRDAVGPVVPMEDKIERMVWDKRSDRQRMTREKQHLLQQIKDKVTSRPLLMQQMDSVTRQRRRNLFRVRQLLQEGALEEFEASEAAMGGG